MKLIKKKFLFMNKLKGSTFVGPFFVNLNLRLKLNFNLTFFSDSSFI